MSAYYNEIDPYAAQWLRNLINAGHIAAGIVDERSIEDVHPSDLRGFTQCHFFAGIGVWSYALRSAGWSDDREIWTGSCPCQPFSAAGKGTGFDDQRHLWPAFHHLIQECKPSIVLGEQVASKDADPWIDLVQADVEALGYGFGAVPFPSASVGAPHIRDRLYWVAHSEQFSGGRKAEPIAPQTDRNAACGVADAGGERRNGRAVCLRPEARGRSAVNLPEAGRRGSALLGAGNAADSGDVGSLHPAAHPGPTNGFWRDADWLLCRDGKWRPVEPGTFPLVAGAAGGMGRVRADWHTPAGKEGFGHRAGRLKGYGNAINAEAARVFIECVMEAA